MTETHALLTLINKVGAPELEDLKKAGYDVAGDIVSELADKQVALVAKALGEEREARDYFVRIFEAYADADGDETIFRNSVWGILNDDSRKAEEKITTNITHSNLTRKEEEQFIFKRELMDAKPCEWCIKLAGEWRHPTASNGVSLFVRHKGCMCKFSILQRGKGKLDLPDVEEMTLREWKNHNWTEEDHKRNQKDKYNTDTR